MGHETMKCDKCGASLADGFNAYPRMLGPYNPYPEEVVVCENPDCIQWAKLETADSHGSPFFCPACGRLNEECECEGEE